MSLAPARTSHRSAAEVAFPLAFAGWGTALPARSVSNDELALTLDTSDAWVAGRTGIRSRHLVGADETTASLAAEAGHRALASAGLAPNDIDLVLVATTTPDRVCPSTAADTAALLGIDAAACDLNAACTSFVSALHLVAPTIAAGSTRAALVIGAERMSSIVDPTDRTTAVLFGDGAGALVLSHRTTPGPGYPPGSRPGVVHSTLGGDSALLSHLEIRPGEQWLHMDGPEVFRAATRALVSSAQAALDGAGLDSSAVDWFIPHQANRRIVDAAVERLDIEPTRTIVTLDRHGNTSAASIPLALAAAADDGRITPGDLVLASAVGAGMTWGSVLLRWGR